MHWLIYIEICLEHLGDHTYYHTIFLQDLGKKNQIFKSKIQAIPAMPIVLSIYLSNFQDKYQII